MNKKQASKISIFEKKSARTSQKLMLIEVLRLPNKSSMSSSRSNEKCQYSNACNFVKIFFDLVCFVMSSSFDLV